MTLRTRLLRVADRVRNLRDPLHLDQATNQVTIVVRTWSGGGIGADAAPGFPDYADVTTVLPQKLPIRPLTTREIANSGGEYEMGDILVDHITPRYTDTDGSQKGYLPTDLRPAVVQGQELFYRITGTHNGEYALRELRTWRNYTYQLVLGRRMTTPRVT